MSDDPYVYPDTNVLRNMRGIHDGGELEEFETYLTFLRGLQLASDPIADRESFIDRLAHYLADVNALHRDARGGGAHTESA